MTEIYEIGPKVLPKEWISMGGFGPAGWAYQKDDGLRVIMTIGPAMSLDPVSQQRCESEWLHVSFSRHKRIPDYGDMVEVKEIFIGKDLKAIMVLPAEKEHVNIHPNCLHLWACLDRDPLPDFTQGTGMI